MIGGVCVNGGGWSVGFGILDEENDDRFAGEEVDLGFFGMVIAL